MISLSRVSQKTQCRAYQEFMKMWGMFKKRFVTRLERIKSGFWNGQSFTETGFASWDYRCGSNCAFVGGKLLLQVYCLASTNTKYCWCVLWRYDWRSNFVIIVAWRAIWYEPMSLQLTFSHSCPQFHQGYQATTSEVDQDIFWFLYHICQRKLGKV